jgi:hypothetical protein
MARLQEWDRCLTTKDWKAKIRHWGELAGHRMAWIITLEEGPQRGHMVGAASSLP